MGYKNDGSVHWNGIKGEHEIISFLNKQTKDKEEFHKLVSLFQKEYNVEYKDTTQMNFIQKGGTKNKEDIYETINEIKISLKTKELKNGKPNGTFDLINTSSLNTLVDESNINFHHVLEKMNFYKEQVRKEYSEKPEIFTPDKVCIVKKEVALQYNKILNSIDGETIKSILAKVINNEVTSTIIYLKNKKVEKIQDTDVYFLKKDWIQQIMEQIDYKQTFENTKSSAFIKNKDGNNSVLRIRVVYNNGVSSLIGIKGKTNTGKPKNTSSALTFKIQIDKVQELINEYGIWYKNLKKD